MKLNVMLAGLSRKCAIGTKSNNKGHHYHWHGYKLHLDVADAQIPIALPVSSVDLSQRKAAFLDALRKYLIELQHSEVTAASASSLSFEELYVPYLDTRRLRSLGSASDHSRSPWRMPWASLLPGRDQLDCIPSRALRRAATTES